MIGGVHHIGISSPDIDRLVAFYRDVMGFEVVLEAGIPEPNEMVDEMLAMKGVTGRAVTMRTGNTFIELIEFITPKGRGHDADWSLADHGHTHIALIVDDIDAEYARMKAAGMHFFRPPIHQPGRKSAATYGMDPDGNRIEIMEMRDQSMPHVFSNRYLERLKDVPEETF
jgi:catechol 2,3-dioxygenase-like lactoylglutathione lyase family enzyme